MVRVLVFLIGFGFSVIGFVYIISYLNLLSLGYNFGEYVKFICSNGICLIGPVGVLMVFFSIFTGGDSGDFCL
ncbi:MAG: hypothetical protein IKE75_03835 [Bacilli bacterium]|nr:hypothetical protein [Bacilli bacterium]